MIKHGLCGSGVLAMAASLLLQPQLSEAQHGGGGGRSGASGNRSNNSSGSGTRSSYRPGGYSSSSGYRSSNRYGNSRYGNSRYGYSRYGYGYGRYGYGRYGYGRYGYGRYGYGGYGYGGTTQAYQSFYPPGTASDGSPNAVHLLVVVPQANARVFFDGSPTRQTGPEREFVTEMAAGTSGTYQIEARWTANGQPRVETRSVRVRPGLWQVVDFNQPPDEGEPSQKGPPGDDPSRKGPPGEDDPSPKTP